MGEGNVANMLLPLMMKNRRARNEQSGFLRILLLMHKCIA